MHQPTATEDQPTKMECTHETPQEDINPLNNIRRSMPILTI
jgi:hypothetical protein